MKKILRAALILLVLLLPAAKAEPRVLRAGCFAYPGFHEQDEDGYGDVFPAKTSARASMC